LESFNGQFRDECLNQHGFLDLADALLLIEAWCVDYYSARSHSVLGNLPSLEFARQSGVDSGFSSRLT
jgi:putative transposase